MLFCPLKLYVSRLCINSTPRFVLPNFGYVIGHSRNSNFSASLVEISPYVGLGLSISCKRIYSCRALHKGRNRRHTSHVEESCEGIKSDSSEANSSANVHTDGVRHILGNAGEDSKRTKGTNKTSHGNKGRVPWNKGRKHSEETREKIRRRTKEALQDPKIRKKMSEAPRVLSYQTKVKIRASLRKLWGSRLKLKRSREKILQSWGESIALAAKTGGTNQQELEWDTYEKFKQEVALQNAEIAKMKELARIRKERAAQVKAKKIAMVAQKRRELEENAKVKGESKKWNKKSKEEKEKLVESQEEKLKERLMKIHRKKSRICRVSNQHRRPLEKFDLDLAKGMSHLQKDILSLADQIRFAKERRAEMLVDKL